VTATPVQDTASVARQRRQRLGAAGFGLVILVLTQYVLGIGYNLYGTAPTPGRKVKLFSSPLLGAHVAVGTLLIVAAIYLVVASIRARERTAIIASAAGLIALLIAWLSGSAFTQEGKAGDSMAMGVATAVALLCYATIVKAHGRLARDGAP
jgi:hypothetical protein